MLGYSLLRPQNLAKFSSYFWLALNRTKVRWRFRKILWLSQNIWTFSCCESLDLTRFWFFFSSSVAPLCPRSTVVIPLIPCNSNQGTSTSHHTSLAIIQRLLELLLGFIWQVNFCRILMVIKVQLISKYPSGVIVWTKIPTNFCPRI